MSLSRITDMGIGAAALALLVAGAAYVNPPARCISERGTVYISAPVAKCYKLADVFPAGAFTPAR